MLIQLRMHDINLNPMNSCMKTVATFPNQIQCCLSLSSKISIKDAYNIKIILTPFLGLVKLSWIPFVLLKNKHNIKDRFREIK